ncbi:response regulator [Asticcacaulis sp. ZE23SCel15]|uniref:response regulator n=1 Tax=Asticcacaulis sp. ZE23SCel15 TaxID=3059027 RepID=UPI00265E5624|nr:response regulator [Asticcacaulis sp. ZE23SCel15]WKL58725.1 response regulator [Asticcacaulis sp. ZE23SCel15]
MSNLTYQTLRAQRKINPATVNILVVEDHDASRRMILELLRGAGFTRLLPARSAEEAIGFLTSHNPDLMVLDWELPGMSGVDLVRAMRQAAVKDDPRFLNPRLPVLMLTGRQKSQDVTHARNCGVDEFVIKPFSTSVLLKAVLAALTRKRNFVVSANYIGPCRRRKTHTTYQGVLRRIDDIEQSADNLQREIFQQTLSVELNSLRVLMQARGGLDKKLLDYMVGRIMHTEKRAHALRLGLIEQATHSLNDYAVALGEDTDPEVVDIHLDTLIRLNEIDLADHREAAKTVQHLERLVSKRKKHRKLTA